MKILYDVHGVSPTDFSVKALVAGKETDAVVPGMILEAVSEDGSMGHSFKVWGEDAAPILKRASPGDKLEVTLRLIDKDGKGVLLNAPIEDTPKPPKPAKAGKAKATAAQ
jgi:hypothetical protein